MSQAVMSDSSAAAVASSGKSGEISTRVTRRGLLGAAAAGAALVAVPVAVADHVQAKADPDAAFWAAHRRLKAIDAEWDAALRVSDTDEVRDHFGTLYSVQRTKMMTMQVFTIAAVLAKYQEVLDGDFQLEDRKAMGSEVIAWDMERLAKREMFL